MTIRTARIPEAAASYFGVSQGSGATGSLRAREDHPIVTREFRPGKGWVTTGYRKRISASWARKLRAEGVESVVLSLNGREADFTTEELAR